MDFLQISEVIVFMAVEGNEKQHKQTTHLQ